MMLTGSAVKVPSCLGRGIRAGVAKETDHRAAVVLTAIAGFVDAAGFLALFGLFTAHVTGNLVVVGAALAG